MLGLDGVGVLGPFVMSFNIESGTCIVCRASIVAEGGVFSRPNSGRVGDRAEGLSVGVSFNGSRDGVGVFDRSNGDDKSSLLPCLLSDVKPLPDEGLSGERSGDLLSR